MNSDTVEGLEPRRRARRSPGRRCTSAAALVPGAGEPFRSLSFIELLHPTVTKRVPYWPTLEVAVSYIRKADRFAFDTAVSEALLAVRTQLRALRDVLPRAIYLTSCPDYLLEELRRDVMNHIGRELFDDLTAPLAPPDESAS